MLSSSNSSSAQEQAAAALANLARDSTDNRPALRACVVLESVRRRRFAPGSSALRAQPAERAAG